MPKRVLRARKRLLGRVNGQRGHFLLGQATGYVLVGLAHLWGGIRIAQQVDFLWMDSAADYHVMALMWLLAGVTAGVLALTRVGHWKAEAWSFAILTLPPAVYASFYAVAAIVAERASFGMLSHVFGMLVMVTLFAASLRNPPDDLNGGDADADRPAG